MALFRDPDGRLLPRRVAAVELVNVLRPTVAVAVYVAFVTHAPTVHPQWRERLHGGDDAVDAPPVAAASAAP